MIKLEIKEIDNKYLIKVSGHSKYDDRGHDIVCAAASMSVNFVINLIDNLGYNIIDFDEKDGYTSFNCIKDDITSKIIKTLLEEFGVLEEEYPGFVKIIK